MVEYLCESIKRRPSYMEQAWFDFARRSAAPGSAAAASAGVGSAAGGLLARAQVWDFARSLAPATPPRELAFLVAWLDVGPGGLSTYAQFVAACHEARSCVESLYHEAGVGEAVHILSGARDAGR